MPPGVPGVLQHRYAAVCRAEPRRGLPELVSTAARRVCSPESSWNECVYKFFRWRLHVDTPEAEMYIPVVAALGFVVLALSRPLRHHVAFISAAVSVSSSQHSCLSLPWICSSACRFRQMWRRWPLVAVVVRACCYFLFIVFLCSGRAEQPGFCRELHVALTQAQYNELVCRGRVEPSWRILATWLLVLPAEDHGGNGTDAARFGERRSSKGMDGKA